MEVADARGFIARTDAYFTVDQSTVTLAELTSAMQTWLAEVQAVCGGRIVGAQFRIGIDVSGFAGKTIEPSAGVASCVALKFANTADGLPWDFVVPAVSTTMIVAGKPDMSEGATIDVLADTMENGTTGPSGFAFVDTRGGVLGPTAGGFLTTRPSLSQPFTKSYTVGA
ncbi:MAG TPA: hypothetical protein VGS80_22185 [Ktedonobacterales bacterium]|nr:hypothetical protein [Ktedonobacterales bacterium]